MKNLFVAVRSCAVMDSPVPFPSLKQSNIGRGHHYDEKQKQLCNSSCCWLGFESRNKLEVIAKTYITCATFNFTNQTNKNRTRIAKL